MPLLNPGSGKRAIEARRVRPPPRPCVRRTGKAPIAHAAFALALILAGWALPMSANSGAPEYIIKAAYLYKFTPFIEWPSSAFATPTSPFNLCVVGADPFGASLDQAMAGHQVGDHPVRVLRLQALDGSEGCHILYLGGMSGDQAAAAISKVHGAPVLTVTEENAAVSGGVIQFVVRDGHVRFIIDAAAAAANRVVISAKLLSLAASTRTGS